MTTPPLPTLREEALYWFFGKTKTEKIDLKEKYFPETYIGYSEQWGFAFTFGQIEQMYLKENKK